MARHVHGGEGERERAGGQDTLEKQTKHNRRELVEARLEADHQATGASLGTFEDILNGELRSERRHCRDTQHTNTRVALGVDERFGSERKTVAAVHGRRQEMNVSERLRRVAFCRMSV
jgi:hypothetical protein